jgi:hypothetical protein
MDSKSKQMLKYNEEDRVKCLYDDAFYDGKIVKCHSNGTYYIQFDDGDVLEDATYEEIKPIFADNNHNFDPAPIDLLDIDEFATANSNIIDNDLLHENMIQWNKESDLGSEGNSPLKIWTGKKDLDISIEIKNVNNQFGDLDISDIQAEPYFIDNSSAVNIHEDELQNSEEISPLGSPREPLSMSVILSKVESFLLPSYDDRYLIKRNKVPDSDISPYNRLSHLLSQVTTAEYIRSIQTLYRDTEDEHFLVNELRLESPTMRLPNKSLVVKITEGRSRIFALSRLCFGNDSIELVRAQIDLANSYALQVIYHYDQHYRLQQIN